MEFNSILIVVGGAITALIGITTLGRKAFKAYAADLNNKVDQLEMKITLLNDKLDQHTASEERLMRSIQERIDEIFKMLAER